MNDNRSAAPIHNSDYIDFNDGHLFILLLPLIKITASDTCAICMDEFVVNESVPQLPCLHVFHEDCLARWLMRTNTCPLCRFQLQHPNDSGRGRRLIRIVPTSTTTIGSLIVWWLIKMGILLGLMLMFELY